MYIDYDNTHIKNVFNRLKKKHGLERIIEISKKTKNINSANHTKYDGLNKIQLETPTTENTIYHSNNSTFGTEWSATGLINR